MHLAAFDALVVFPWLDALMRQYATHSVLVGWGIGMLSYHQDAKYRYVGWAVVSQILAVVCLVAVVVFGFTHRSWLNFVIAPALIWLHVQFTKRWWAKPGGWW